MMLHQIKSKILE